MARQLKKEQLKAGHTFYVITVEDTIEAYRVIKRKGNKFSVCSEGGPVGTELLSAILNQVNKFPTRGAVHHFAKLRGVKLNS